MTRIPEIARGTEVYIDFGPLTGKPRPDHCLVRTVKNISATGMLEVDAARGKKSVWISRHRVLVHPEMVVE